MHAITLLEAFSRLQRWWGLSLFGILVGLALGQAAYRALPKVYESRTTILVAPPQIPQAYVRSAVAGDMAVRLRSLEEAVLSRPYLERVVREVYGLPEGDPSIGPLVARVRHDLVVDLREYDQRRGTGVFQIVCRDEDPQRAARLANLLADLYIAENVQQRIRQASQTAATLHRLAEEVRDELEQKEKAIADFRSRHLYELPENLPSNLHLLEARRSELESVERALREAEDRLSLLEAARQAGSTSAEPRLDDPLLRRRQELETEIARLRSRYTEQNPLLRARLEELAELERQIRSRLADGADRPTPLGIEEEKIRAEIRRLRVEREKLRREIDTYQARIEAAPRVAQRLDELKKGYEALAERYRKYRSDYEEARGSARIEEERKGAQFEVLERATPARSPVRPRPMVVFGGAAIAGWFLTGGIFFLLFLARPVVLSRRGLAELLEIDGILVVPLLPLPATRRATILRHAANGTLVLAGALMLFMAWFSRGPVP